MERFHYTKGESILQQGDVADYVCRIVTGHAEVVREVGDSSVVLGIVGPGEFVGEMAVIEQRGRSATVRAVDSVTADRIEKADFFRMMSEDKELAHSLILRLSERLRMADQMLADAAGVISGSAAGIKPVAIPVKVSGGQPRMTLFAGHDRVSRDVPEEGLPIEELPFVIGRKHSPHEDAPSVTGNLLLLDMKPYRLSRLHFAIEQSGDSIVVRDLGSHLGTRLNDLWLGEAFGRDSAPLEMGDNTIAAGGLDAPFVFTLRLEEKSR